MKKIVLALLICLLLGSLVGTVACNKPEPSTQYYTQELEFSLLPNKTYGVAIGNAMSVEEIIIPPTYKGKKVSSILDTGFFSAVNLKAITIPNSVTEIGSDAFYNCDGLTEIVMPNSVTYIGPRAFDNCSNLTKILIPDSVTCIDIEAFSNCSSLTEVTIPDSVTIIGGGTFRHCSNLSSVTIGENVNWIASSMFYECISLREIVIPNSATEIGSNAFKGCNQLTEIVIPNSITSIGNEAFRNCKSLSRIVIGKNVTKIGQSAFLDCDNLDNVNYMGTIEQWAQIDFVKPESNPIYHTKKLHIDNELVTEVKLPTATQISNYAFYNCQNISSVIIGKNVSQIGDSAFTFCSNLTEIVIGNSVTSIGNWAFDYSGLKTVYYNGTEDDWNKISIGSYNTNLTNAMRYYYSESEPALNSSGTAYKGNYWHYIDGVPTVWIKEN